MEPQTQNLVASTEGGLIVIDEEGINGIIMDLVKNIWKKVMEGSLPDVLRMSRPARISSPLTYLHAVVGDFSHSNLLNRAADCGDPVRRLQYVAAFLISGLHVNPVRCKNKPPLNPILGETLQMVKDDGTTIFLEQISHHPPISAWEMQGPGYRFYGHGQLIVRLTSPNVIYGYNEGKRTIEFASDAGKVTFTCPAMSISGILIGDRVVNYTGSCLFEDATNGLTLELEFNPPPVDKSQQKQGVFSSLKSWWNSSGPVLPSDHFKMSIKRRGQAIQELQGRGSWLEFVEFGSEKLWTIRNVPELPWKELPENEKLPSDSSFRRDLQLLKVPDYMNAQIAKDEVENIQRRDKTLRGH